MISLEQKEALEASWEDQKVKEVSIRHLGLPGGLGAPPYLGASSFISWHKVQVSWIMFGEKITFPKVSFRLDSFDIPFLRNPKIGKK